MEVREVGWTVADWDRAELSRSAELIAAQVVRVGAHSSGVQPTDRGSSKFGGLCTQAMYDGGKPISQRSVRSARIIPMHRLSCAATSLLFGRKLQSQPILLLENPIHPLSQCV